MIYVLPGYQGKKVGHKLLEKGIAWLGREKDISVTAVEYNENAINFYEKHGFVKTGVADKHELPNGKIMPEVELVLKSTRLQIP